MAPWKVTLMFGRKRETVGIEADLRALRESAARADSVSTEVVSARPKVESLVSSIVDRRTRNGFGEDYEISKTLRGA